METFAIWLALAISTFVLLVIDWKYISKINFDIEEPDFVFLVGASLFIVPGLFVFLWDCVAIWWEK